MHPIRLAAFDIDGTLLDSAKELRPRTREAIAGLAGRGIVVALATGRIHPSAAEIATALEVDAPIVSLNGSCVRSAGGAPLHDRPIAPGEVSRLLDRVERERVFPFLFLGDEIVLRSDSAPGRSALDRWTSGRHYRPVASFDDVDEPVLQIHLVSPAGAGPAIHAALADELDGGFDLFGYGSASGETYHLEIRTPGDDKGTGLDRIREDLGIAREEVLAAGDWLNDLALLGAAGVAVAMRGAPDALVRRADHVTPGSSDEDGLAAFLEAYFDL